MRTHCLCLFFGSLSLSCSGSSAESPEPPQEADDVAVSASGGFRADEASSGAASWQARQARHDNRTDAAAGGTGMGGDAPVEEKPVAIPSAACALPAVVPEDRKLDLTFAWGPIPVSLPPGYDGAVPGPIIIAFPAGRDGLHQLVEESGRMPNPLLEDYIIARPRPLDSEYSTWEGLSVEDYDAVYRELAAQVCFDEARVMGIGSGGGGRFLIWMAGKPTLEGIVRPPQFRAMAVSGPAGNQVAPWPDVPLLLIHSTRDLTAQNVWGDPDGRLALEKRRESQGCDETPLPAGSTQYGGVTYTCSDFGDCSSFLRFCSHDMPTYSDIWETPHNIEIHRFFGEYL